VIERWSQGIADDNMAEDILVDLARIVQRHPWWKARAALTLELLKQLGVKPPAPVLDAGCGWGVTLDVLEERGYTAVGMDISRRTLEMLDCPGRRLAEADLTKPLEQVVEPHDAVLALDVIEHVDDDRDFVARLAELTKPGGVVVVSVPALPDMFTEFDKIQGHRRRYLPETLRAAFDGTGLEVERIFWWGQWLVPNLRRQRARPRRRREGESTSDVYRHYLKLPPLPVVWVAQAAFAYEQGRALNGQLHQGTSLFAVGRKRGG
jgi:2-polyprenyl-3-methyl-5-hydroxy-6-metoxy-1,4-benzoquinol methylase